MATLEIPMDNTSPAFNFSVDLDENSYEFRFRWSDRVNLWIFDLYDNEDNAIFQGKPFQTLVNLLQQSSKINTPTGTLVAVNSETQYLDADRFAIGGNVKLFYIEAENG